MTDTVLQSFCERCGTRYTFNETEQKADPGRSKLGRLGRRGSQEAADEPSVSTALPSSEQFDGTFHFCLECRQYACANCWNAQEGYCVGCRPPGFTADTDTTTAVTIASDSKAPPKGPPDAAATTGEPSAWPSDDLDRTGQPVPHVHVHAPPSTESRSTPEATASADATTKTDTEPSKAGSPWGGSSGGRQPSGSTDAIATDAIATDAIATDAKTVDEWGRPASGKPDPRPQTSRSDLPFDRTNPAADPWQGVVFSEDGDEDLAKGLPPEQPPQRVVFTPTDPETSRAATRWPSAASSTAKASETDVVAPDLEKEQPAPTGVWPDADRSSETTAKKTTTPSVWPEIDRKGDGFDVDAKTAAESGVAHEVTAKSGVSPTARAAEPEERPVAELGDEAETDDSSLSAAERILGTGKITAAAVIKHDGDLDEVDRAADLGDENAAAAASEPAPWPAAPEVPVNATLSFAEPEEPGSPADVALSTDPDPEAVKTEASDDAEAAEIKDDVEVTASPAPPEMAPVPDMAAPEPPNPLVPVDAPPNTATGVPGRTATPPGPFAQPYQQPAPPPPPVAPSGPAQQPPPSAPYTQQPSVHAVPAAMTMSAPLPPPVYQPPPQQPLPPPPPPLGFVSGPPLAAAPPRLPHIPQAAQRTASQGCASCGIPLSAKARFCRRCGAAQP